MARVSRPFLSPGMPYVRCAIGDEEVPIMAKHLLNMTHNLEVGNLGGFNLSLFDPAFEVLEDAFTRSVEEDVPVLIRYGWQDGPTSDVFRTTLTNYTPTFEAQGVTLNLSFNSLEASRSFREVKTRGFPNQSIDSIVRQLFLEDGWEVPDGAITPTTDTSKEFTYVQSNMSNITFIKSVLAPDAVAKNSNVGGYRFRHIGRKAYFQPIQPSSLVRQYVFAHDSNGVVLSFSPGYNGNQVIYRSGTRQVRGVAWTTSGKTHEYLTLDVDSPVIQQQLGSVTTTLPRRSIRLNDKTISPPPKEGKVGRSFIHPYTAGSPESLAYVKAKFDVGLTLGFPAEATIMGDPTILPQDYVEFVVLRHDGVPHTFSSGMYQVDGVQHSISGGNWVTTLKMHRDSTNSGRVIPGEKFKSLGERDTDTGSILIQSTLEE